MKLTTKLISSLEKVFPKEAPEEYIYTSASCLLGELFSFQIAVYTDEGETADIPILLKSSLNVKLSAVRCVPVMLPAYNLSHDDNYLSVNPGVFPDLLIPINDSIRITPTQWRSLWVEVCANTGGDFPIAVTIGDNELCFTLKVISAELPKQKLISTQWFHCDCLSDYYGVAPLSEEHWKLIDSYMANYVKYGMNMILTPVLTPPLDTVIGGERPTVQLVDIYIKDGTYTFSYDNLDRFIKMAQKHGMQYFEISHPFSQWGAGFAPKVIAIKNGIPTKIFGWETIATSPEYSEFICLFISELKLHLKKLGIFEKSYFHVSDEPDEENQITYGAAVKVLEKVYADCNVIDALSDYCFYEQGLVKTPIPSNDHIEPFLEHNVKDLWTYYCCAQNINVSNRFIAMPSARNRIIAYQLFKYNIVGFLHWGFNFWNNQNSRNTIDPFSITDAEEAFPGGDPFSVYPDKDGNPLSSIRQVVFNEAMQDLRAMELLNTYISKDEILALIASVDSSEITFSKYPQNPEFILESRELINREIAKHIT